jgi:rfaE bifunctional protein nucleotidyltransferase chain/domain
LLVKLRSEVLSKKIKSLAELKDIRNQLRRAGKKVVFTNGVFDLLHRGHVEYLETARSLGDVLILGLNSDASAKMVKGSWKPLVEQEDRAIVLAGLISVDYICFFDEETPLVIISALQPDILVKGGDYQLDGIVGRDVVEAGGGKVVTVPLTPGKSTTEVVKRIAKLIREGKIVA